jgi:prolipoprotein diacylglyceryltransferase
LGEAGLPIHTVFDVLAWSGGALLAVLVRRLWLGDIATPQLFQRPWWYVSAILGALAGAVALGSLNMHLAGLPGMGKSVVGALAGAILAVELYKRATGLSGSTGIGVVAPLAFGIAVGRVGCLLAGLEDFTYGTPTSLPWGMDFGDGVLRHPVQLYESLTMAAFLVWFLVGLARGGELARRHGFALFVAVYAGQRFAWEFFKPYPGVAGPFNLFHLTCLGLLAYAAWLIQSRSDAHAPA